MAINKVEFGGNTLIDITDTTATSSNVANGEVFYNADGTRGVGTLSIEGITTLTDSTINLYSLSNGLYRVPLNCTLKYDPSHSITCTNDDAYVFIERGSYALKGYTVLGWEVMYQGKASGTSGGGTCYKNITEEDVVNNLDCNVSNSEKALSAYQGYYLDRHKHDTIDASNKLDYAYLKNTPTIPTKVSELNNDSGFITSYTETDPVFSASASAGISSSDITNWNGKQTVPTVLYNNTSGTTSSITTLSDNLSNYSYIEIFYGWESGGFGILSTRYDLSSSYGVNLSTMVFNNNYIYFATSKWTASGTNLTLSGGEYWRGRVANQSAFTRTQSNNVAIFKVLGYK